MNASFPSSSLCQLKNALFSAGAVSIVSKELIVGGNTTMVDSFVIDDSVGKNTRISVFYSQNKAPVVSLAKI